MKNVLTILTTTILFTVLGASCVKNTPNCGALPCPTATGANVLSCNINGKPYIAKGGKPDLGGILGGCKQGCYIGVAPFGGAGFSINADFCTIGYRESLTIFLGDSMKTGSYILDNGNRANYDGISCPTITDSNHNGIITITSLTDKSISGTFSFIGVNNVKFTEGNFDIAR